ncbi:hypothetical protein DRN67_00880 [Candidatus Micrarchaeota archaeon]|nr:MAG: hypothetical protein DRN67_00880 [Candidatus Micrarchaeota archaeon]
MKRAQVSLEFLILLIAFLAFLAAWLPLLAEIKEGAERRVALNRAREAGARLAGALDDVCILGEGNVRELELNFVDEVKVEVKGRRVFVIGKNYAVSIERLCSGSEFSMEFEGQARLRISAEDGGIKVERINKGLT